MAKCAFCQNALIPGYGKMYVKVSGDIFYFCNSKCEKNWNLGREGKDFKWTPASQKKNIAKK